MLQVVADNLWEVRNELKMPGGILFPIRMMVMKLSDGTILLHSPIKATPELVEEVSKLGEIAYLAGPNCFHHLYLNSWIKACPNAKVFLAPKLEKKQPSIIDFQHLSNESPWPDDLELRLVGGMPMLGEVVFYHRSSKTLILTDLIFNIPEAKNLASKIMFGFIGKALGRPATSRLVKWSTKDKQAAWRDCQAILGWDFERVVMAHGTIIDHDAKDILTEAWSWLKS